MIPIPAPGTIISSTTPVVVAVAPEYYPVIYFVLGMIIAVLIVGLVIRVFGKGAKAVLKRRR